MTEEKNELRAEIRKIPPLQQEILNLFKDSRFVLRKLNVVGKDDYPIIEILLTLKSK